MSSISSTIKKTIILPFKKQSLYLTIPIAILYPLFFSKLYDLMNNAKKIKEQCNAPYTNKRFNFQRCYKDQQIKQTKLNDSKFTFMLIIGLIGIVLGLYLLKKNNMYGVSTGLSAGGLITIILYTVYNWASMAEIKKVIVTGFAIIVLLYASYRSALHYSGLKKDTTVGILT
jgi:hypothetical protein